MFHKEIYLLSTRRLFFFSSHTESESEYFNEPESYPLKKKEIARIKIISPGIVKMQRGKCEELRVSGNLKKKKKKPRKKPTRADGIQITTSRHRIHTRGRGAIKFRASESSGP